MSQSPQPTTTVDAQALSRRELQYLARELELCRGNAKSDVIVEHVVTLMASNDGAGRVRKAMNEMPEDLKLRTPGGAMSATPAKRTRDAPREEVTPRAMDFAEDETPSRRSTRKSARATPVSTATPQPESEKEADPVQKRSKADASPRVERKMAFETDEHDDTQDATEAVAAAASTKVNTPVKPTKTSKTTPVSVGKKASTTPVKSPTAKRASTPEVAIPTSSPAPTPATTTKKAASTPPTSTRCTTPLKNAGRSPLANVSNLATPTQPTPAATPSKNTASSVEALVQSTSDLVFVAGTTERVKCTTTGHEMKADYDVITAYMAGKRYQRARLQQKLSQQSLTTLAPMFVDHPDASKPHMVWCSVTQTAIARDMARIQSHMEGARYQKELPQWRADQKAAAAVAELEKQKAAERAKAKAKFNKTSSGRTTNNKTNGKKANKQKRKAEAIAAAGENEPKKMTKRSRVNAN